MDNQDKNNQISENEIEQKVMTEINSGHIKLRSKYIFLAEKIGRQGFFALDILLAILFFNLVLYYFKSSGNLGYLSFGSRGVFAFLESFPYLLIIVLIILILIAGLLIRQSDISYKKPFVYVSIGLVLFIMVLGGILTFTDVAERFENESYSLRPTGRLLRPLLRDSSCGHGHSVIGQVVEVGNGFVVVQTPCNLTRLDLSQLEMPLVSQIAQDLFIMAIGQTKNDVFEVHNLRITGDNEFPMVHRSVLWQLNQIMK